MSGPMRPVSHTDSVLLMQIIASDSQTLAEFCSGYRVMRRSLFSKLGPDQNPDVDGKVSPTDNENDNICRRNTQLTTEGKKDPYVRRHELLVESGFAEVTVGGTNGILLLLSGGLDDLHKAIASLEALLKITESEVKHVYENFNSN